jgi:hypothetical protein
MWIAQKTGLPTLNGQTGWWPPGWRLFYPDIDYPAAAREWIARSGLAEQVCLYDRPTHTWSAFR